MQQADYWKIGYRIDFANPCAQKYVDSIADQLAAWGVNFLKFDSVTPGSGVSDLSLDARDDVAAWSKALKKRGIWFELSWALDINYADYWKQYANGWRLEWDVECYCAGVALTQWDNIARLFPPRPTGGVMRVPAAGTTSTRSTSATERWTVSPRMSVARRPHCGRSRPLRCTSATT